MALITPADIAKAMGTQFATGSTAESQAQFFCDQIEAYITDRVGELFSVQTVTEKLQADYDGIIQLSKGPVNSIASVKKTDGATRVGWSFDEIDEIDGLEAHEVVVVTYSAGHSSPPGVLKFVAASAATRQMVNPNGIRQETVGAMSQTFAAGDGASGTVYFTSTEELILNKYKMTMTTWHTGPRSRSWRTAAVLPTL